MKNLIFLGMIGSKAKAVAKEAAELLGRKFVDTDEVLTRNSGMSLHDLYMLLPFNSFNDLTYRLSKQLSEGEDYVIAVGDSILKNNDAISVLRSTAFSVYIRQDIESVVSDCTDSSHPLLARGLMRLYELYSERKELFADFSDIVIDYSENASNLSVSAYNSSQTPDTSNADHALTAFFKYYIEGICPEADKDGFASECADFVSKILKKYISEVNDNEH